MSLFRPYAIAPAVEEFRKRFRECISRSPPTAAFSFKIFPSFRPRVLPPVSVQLLSVSENKVVSFCTRRAGLVCVSVTDFCRGLAFFEDRHTFYSEISLSVSHRYSQFHLHISIISNTSKLQMAKRLHSAPQCEVEKLTEGGDENIPIILHPLVVLNVSDHYTRYAAMQMFPDAVARRSEPGSTLFTDGGTSPRVLGILLGTQRGRLVEVCHSFELPARCERDGRTAIDTEFMKDRIAQYQQIFANYSVVGWYCIGSEVTEEDIRMHTEVFCVLNEAPMLLLMNPSAKEGPSTSQPNPGVSAVPNPSVLTTYQMELKVVDNQQKTALEPVPHRYASEDSERIAVDHVMRHAIPGGGDGTSSTTVHLGTLRRSILMLKNRLQLILAFLEATAEGKIEMDHALLRQVSSVCARLPALDSKEFSDAFAEEKNDSLVVTYLSGVTKSLCSMHDAVEMFSRFSDKAVPMGSTGRRRAVFSRP